MTKSDQIIQKYCGSVEERVEACCDEQVAECLKESIDAQLKQSCDNEAIIRFIRRYLDNLIQARFAGKEQ